VTCAFVNDPDSPLARAASGCSACTRAGAQRGRHQELHRAAGRRRAAGGVLAG
jgi:hypothetical protein